MFELEGTTLAWVIGGLVAGLVLELLVFWAGCALGDLDLPSYLASFFVVAPLYLVCMGTMLYFVNTMGGDATGPQAPGAPISWNFTTIAYIALACLGANIVLAGVVYTVVLSTTLFNGVFIALMEIILRVLMTALIVTVVLVALAGVQIYRTQADSVPIAPVVYNQR